MGWRGDGGDSVEPCWWEATKDEEEILLGIWGRKALRRKAACTARSRSHVRAMAEEMSEGRIGVDSGAKLLKVNSRRMESRDWLQGATIRLMPSFRKASRDAW